MCRQLNVSKQGYYEWRKRRPSRTKLRHEYLQEQIRRIYDEHKGRYGSPRIAQQLYDEGIETSKRVVALLMREAGLCAKGFQRRTASYGKGKSIEEAIKENLLKRQFDQDQVDAIWVTDITYIPCSDGRLYLCTYIDLTTRIPRCFDLSSSMKKEIVLRPIERYTEKLPDVIHSDRGSQYRSHRFRELLEEKHVLHSMSEPATPVDNAVVESFFKSIKRELVYPNRHKTKSEMKVLIQDYLLDYYPNRRIHTKFMMTPGKYEDQLAGI